MISPSHEQQNIVDLVNSYNVTVDSIASSGVNCLVGFGKVLKEIN